MSQKGSCEKLLTVTDLECASLDIEQDLSNSNKSLLAKLLKGFCRLTELLEQKEPGIYSLVITWFRLYLKMQTSIDPKNSKLLQQYEKTVPTAISYIIGCLQYNLKDASNFHYNLLEVIDGLLQNCKPNVVKQCANFTNGTIACIWKPISFVGDFNTQTLALKIFAKLLKSLDEEKQEGELKTIKWSNLNLFKDKLNKVIEGTSQIYVYENACRELLNNFNMELTKNVLIYSFYCKSLVIGYNFEFFKPLIMDKFWVDINYQPQTISFRGRHKFEMNLNFEDVDVNLKWSNIKLQKGCLFFTIDNTIESKLPVNISSKLKKHDTVKIYLEEKEEKRLRDNEHMMKCTNVMEVGSNVQYNKDKSSHTNKDNIPATANNLPGTPVTSRSNTTINAKHYLLRQQTPKRIFFGYLEEKDTKLPKQARKKTTNKKPRILKPRCDRKSVCKVVPVVVDLTRTPELQASEVIHPQPMERITNIEQHISDGNECRISDKQCLFILKKVSNSTNKQETYNYHHESDAEPCQSYRCFKTRSIPSCSGSPNFAVCITDRTKNSHTEKLNEGQTEINEKSSAACLPKAQYRHNKENNNVDNATQPSKLRNNNKRKLLSQNIFDRIKEDDSNSTRPSKVLRKSSTSNKETHTTLNHSSTNESEEDRTECDVLRFSDNVIMCSTPVFSPKSLPKTPTSTNTMNILDINNTPNVMNTSDYFLEKEPRTENEIADHFLFGADNQEDKGVLIDCQIYQKDTSSKCNKGNQVVDTIIDSPEYRYEKNYQSSNLKGCVIYRKRLDSDDSGSESGDINLDSNNLKSPRSSTSKQPEFLAAPPLNLTSPNKQMCLNKLGENDIIAKTKYHLSGYVEQRIQVSTEKTVMFNTHVKSEMINKANHTEKQFALPLQSLNSIFSNYDMNDNANDKNNCNSIGQSVIGLQTSVNKMVVKYPQSFGSTLNNKEGELFKQAAITKSVNDAKTTMTQANSTLGNLNNEYLTNKSDSGESSHDSKDQESCTNSKLQPDQQWLCGEFENMKHTGNSEDSTSNVAYCPMSEKDAFFKSDLSNLKEQYYIKLGNKLNNLRVQCLTSTFDETKNKICEITEHIVRQSKEHRKDLELLQMAMERLMRQIECQYEIYVNRTKQFECFQENAERILEAFGCLSLQSGISNGYQDIIDQFNVAEISICKEKWQNFFELHRDNLLQEINSLSDI